MASPINKEVLEHLAKLSRIELDQKEETKLLADLEKILKHFEELRAVDTTKVPPLTGGNDLRNVFREDSERKNTDQGKGVEGFPETQDGLLKIPPVFE